MEDLLQSKPLDRIRESSGDLLSDKIDGILIGFAQVLKERNGWVDVITVSQAEKEIMELIRECGGNPELNYQ